MKTVEIDGKKWHWPANDEIDVDTVLKVRCPGCKKLNFMHPGFRLYDYQGFICWCCGERYLFGGFDEDDIDDFKTGQQLFDTVDGEPVDKFFGKYG